MAEMGKVDAHWLGKCSGPSDVLVVKTKDDALAVARNKHACHNHRIVLSAEWSGQFVRRETAKGMAEVLDEVQYCLTNVWALDRKKFEESILPKIKHVLAAYEAEVK